MASQIRWKRGDFSRLGRAISDFNKKIRELQSEENKLYLPEELNYREAKEDIKTRNELNRLINSLKRFQRPGAENLYVTEAGEEITTWERKELGIQSRTAQNRLMRELKSLNEPTESGYSRVQMGSLRVREIEAQLRNLKKIEISSGYDFKRLKERLNRLGSSNYEMKKAITYRENYLRELQKYSHLDNYDKLIEKLKSITNPIEFFNFMSANELTQDLTYQSDEYYTQEAFNSYILQLGIDIDIDSTILPSLMLDSRYKK